MDGGFTRTDFSVYIGVKGERERERAKRKQGFPRVPPPVKGGEEEEGGDSDEKKKKRKNTKPTKSRNKSGYRQKRQRGPSTRSHNTSEKKAFRQKAKLKMGKKEKYAGELVLLTVPTAYQATDKAKIERASESGSLSLTNPSVKQTDKHNF